MERLRDGEREREKGLRDKREGESGRIIREFIFKILYNENQIT